MSDITRRQLLTYALAEICLSRSQYLSAATKTRDFKIFDHLFYKNKPDLSKYHFCDMHIGYTWEIWGESRFNYAYSEVPEKAIDGYFNRYFSAGKPVPNYFVLDIEHWKLYNTSPGEIDKNIRNYQRVFDRFRKVLPRTAKLSYYNIAPLPNHGDLAKKLQTPAEYVKWRKANDMILPLINKMDFVTPSLYYQTNFSIDGWKRKADAFIKECRRLAPGKKVYPFIWPEYSNTKPLKEIDGFVWRNILQFMDANADGFVLWRRAGGLTASTWNNSADWWRETIKYLDRTKISCP